MITLSIVSDCLFRPGIGGKAWRPPGLIFPPKFQPPWGILLFRQHDFAATLQDLLHNGNRGCRVVASVCSALGGDEQATDVFVRRCFELAVLAPICRAGCSPLPPYMSTACCTTDLPVICYGRAPRSLGGVRRSHAGFRVRRGVAARGGDANKLPSTGKALLCRGRILWER